MMTISFSITIDYMIVFSIFPFVTFTDHLLPQNDVKSIKSVLRFTQRDVQINLHEKREDVKPLEAPAAHYQTVIWLHN